MVTLALCMIVLFIASLMVFQSSSSMLFEIKTGNNTVRQKQALEAARGGLDYATAWVMASGSSSAFASASNWNNASQATSSLIPANVSSQTIGNSDVDVTLKRISVDTASGTTTTVLEISASSKGDGAATVSQRLALVSTNSTVNKTTTTTTNQSINLATVAPIIINGDLGKCGKQNCVNGTPTVSANENSQMILTKTGSYVDTGFINKNKNDPPVVTGNFTSSSAWDFVFPNIKMQDMKAAADYKTIYYYGYDPTSGNFIPDYSSLPKTIGSAQAPIILIFDSASIPLGAEKNKCPSFSGNYTIFGIVYFSGNCTQYNGWGGTTITGSLITESSINTLNANTAFIGWKSTTGSSTINFQTSTSTTESSTVTTTTLARKAASWRDF